MADKQGPVPAARQPKADFSRLYNQQNPREYFAVLLPLKYRLPQQTLTLVQTVYKLSARNDTPGSILDVCCSYGINAGLLRHELDLDSWAQHYTGSQLCAEQQFIADRSYFASRLRPSNPSVLGLDNAAQAIEYSLNTGLLDAAWAEDLETHDPSPELCEALGNVDLILCTGGVGYVGAATFARLVAKVSKPTNTWIVSTVLRMFSYDEIASVLSSHGLVTEKLPGVMLRQRRFVSAQEQSDVLARLATCGLKPSELETEGYFCAEVYISRPSAMIFSPPIAELASKIVAS